MAGAACQLGGRFSRCTEAPQHRCQYCGRHFCARHSHYVEGYEAVCSRKRCVRKQEDLVVHLEYKRRVTSQNRSAICGEEGCRAVRPAFQCSLCHGHFCPDHLRERMYRFSEGWVGIDRPVSICRHCWARRKIWRGR